MDEVERQRQLNFLEDYEQGTETHPAGALAKASDAQTKAAEAKAEARQLRGPRTVRHERPGQYWCVAARWLDVAEYSLRALVALSAAQWKPPPWLRDAVLSQTKTIVWLAGEAERMLLK